MSLTGTDTACRDKRPRSYIDVEKGEKDYYIQTRRKPVVRLISSPRRTLALRNIYFM